MIVAAESVIVKFHFHVFKVYRGRLAMNAKDSNVTTWAHKFWNIPAS